MAAPEIVNVMYRNIDGVHVFTSEDVRGLYVAGRDLHQTYEEVPEALHEMMKYHKIDVSYRPTMSTKEFLRFVGDPDALPDPFRSKCPECGGLGKYQRKQVRLVQLQRNN